MLRPDPCALFLFGGATIGPLAAGVTYFNIELDRSPYSNYPTLKELEGPASIGTVSGALGWGYSITGLRLGLGEGEMIGEQGGIDASIDVFAGLYSNLERSEKECCYPD